MSDKKLLVIGSVATTPWARDQARRLSEQARRRGLTLVGVDTPANLDAASTEDLSYADETVALDVLDAAACRAWAATRSDIDAVLTTRELAVHTAATVAYTLGVAGNAPEAVLRIRNKDECRQRLREAGFPQPLTALCANRDDALAFMRTTGPGPWVVKPRDGLGSIGVTVVHHPSEVSGALDRLPTSSTEDGASSLSPFLIETFVAGEEYSAEGVMIGGVPQVLALTRKTTLAGGTIEMSHSVPAGLDGATEAEASETVARALTAVGITRGIFHVEFWVTTSGIVLGELHDRAGGDFIHALVEYSRPGLELYGMLIDDLLGWPTVPVPEATRAAHAEFLVLPPGTLRKVHGWRELVQHPSVLAAHLQVAPGDVIPDAVDSFTRAGLFVAGAPTPDELVPVITALRSLPTFDIDH